MTRVETRPLTEAERQQLVADKSAAPGSAARIGTALGLLVVLPALGALAGVNVGGALGHPVAISAAAGFVVVLLGAAFAWQLFRHTWDPLVADQDLRLRRDLDEAIVERWDFEVARGWDVACGVARVALLQTPDDRLLLVASHVLETLAPGEVPAAVTLAAVPRLERLLTLEIRGARGAETARVAFEELGGLEYPMKKRRFHELAPGMLPAPLRERLGLAADVPAVDLPPRAMRRAVPWSEPWDRAQSLVPPSVRLRARLWTASVPSALVVLILAAPWLPPRARAFLRAPGVRPSLVPVAVALFLAGAIRGDAQRRRAIARVLSGDVSGLPPAWRRDVVHHEGTVTSAGTVLRRVRHVLELADLLEGDDFVLDGRLTVDVRHAWLFEGEPDFVRHDAGERAAMAAAVGADLRRDGRRLTWNPVDAVAAGDRVHVVGMLDEVNQRLHGTAERPLLVWRAGTSARVPA